MFMTNLEHVSSKYNESYKPNTDSETHEPLLRLMIPCILVC